MRAFIAIELSEECKKELAGIITILKGSGTDVKWVDPKVTHLTLKFLGDISEAQSEKIKKHLAEAANKTSPFDFALEEIGAFPSWNNPRVLWVGIKDEHDNVRKFAERMEDDLAPEGFEKESRAFKAHLTLGRVRGLKNQNKLKSLADSIKVNPAITSVSKVTFFRSTLTSEGALHTPIAEYHFSHFRDVSYFKLRP